MGNSGPRAILARVEIMELTPLSHQHIDRRLRDIDRQIHSALRDIRRNLEELEQASQGQETRPASRKVGANVGFADVLRDAMEGDGRDR